MSQLIKILCFVGVAVATMTIQAPSAFAQNNVRCNLALKSRDLSAILQPGLLFRKKKNLYVVTRNEKFSTSGDDFMDARQIEVVKIYEQSPGPHLFKDAETISIFDRNFFTNAELVTEAGVKWGIQNKVFHAAQYNRDLLRGHIFQMLNRHFIVNIPRADTVEAFEIFRDGTLDQEPYVFKMKGELYPDGVEAFEFIGRADLTFKLDFY